MSNGQRATGNGQFPDIARCPLPVARCPFSAVAGDASLDDNPAVRRLLLAIFLLPLFAFGDETGGVRGKVSVLSGGQPRRDASGVVVYLTGFEEPPPDAVPELRQRGRQFQPALLAITAGQAVSFPNGDPFFHN